CPHPSPTETYTLSLHDALPISRGDTPVAPRGGPTVVVRAAAAVVHGAATPRRPGIPARRRAAPHRPGGRGRAAGGDGRGGPPPRSEEHTSELQSRSDLVCRLLL